ncbi:hypothetical protein D3C85_15300 [compost metagenome]
MAKSEHANKEYFERLEVLVRQVATVEGAIVLNVDSPTAIQLSTLDGLLDLYRKPEHHSMYNMINRFYVVLLGKAFEYLLETPVVTAFEFKVTDKTVTLNFETLKDGRFSEEVDFVGKADKIWLCRLLGGLSPVIKVQDYNGVDFTFALKDKELTIEVINQGGEIDGNTA